MKTPPMDVGAPPAGPGVASSVGPRSRRPGRVLRVAAVLLGGLAVGGLVWASRYHPIGATDGGFFLVARPARLVTTTAPPYDGPSFGVYRVDYDEGQALRLGFTLHNRGTFPVRVIGIRAGSPAGFPLRLDEVALRDDAERPFEPFTLAPGAFQRIVTTWRFAGACPPPVEGPATLAALGGVDVHYRFLSFDRAVSLPLPYVLHVRLGDFAWGEPGEP